VHQLLRDRENAYKFADFTVDTTDLAVDEIVDTIIRQFETVTVE
jgi:hypothetical protein